MGFTGLAAITFNGTLSGNEIDSFVVQFSGVLAESSISITFNGQPIGLVLPLDGSVTEPQIILLDTQGISPLTGEFVFSLESTGASAASPTLFDEINLSSIAGPMMTGAGMLVLVFALFVIRQPFSFGYP